MKKLKILHLQTGGGSQGGIAGYIEVIVNSELSNDYDFSVIVGNGEIDHLSRSRKYGAANLFEAPPTYGLFSILSYLIILARILRGRDVNLIHAHALRAGMVAAMIERAIGVKFIYTNHGLRFSQKSGWLRRLIFLYLEKFVVSSASNTICIRPSDYQRMKDEIAPSLTKINLITTSINPQGGVRHPFRMEQRRSFQIVGIGSLIDVKRPDRFIEWVGGLSQAGFSVKATWLGDGPLRSVLQNDAEERSIQIEWAGHVDAVEVAKRLGSADLMFLTSDFEVLSLAALEAMSVGVPIVTTDFFGVCDFVVPDETGIILPARADLDLVISKIGALLNDPEKLDAMNVKSRKLFSARFSGSSKMAGSYGHLYGSLLRD